MKQGDRVRQVRWETEPQYGRDLLGTVVSVDATGKPDVRWDDGTYCSLPAGWLQVDLAPAAYIDGCVVRTARKVWRCECRGHRNEYPGDRVHAERCLTYIDRGQRYVEYLGEAAGYQSGTRYCQPCADRMLRK